MALRKISLVLLLCLFCFYSETAKSQNCGCAADLCCSQHGYCGTNDDYCGTGCQSGPCGASGNQTEPPSVKAYCGCSPILCCSQHGFCGVNDDYCGSGCKSGPCRKSREPIDRMVTQKFFNGIISQAANGCAGKRFYTRDSFLEAANTTFNFTSTVTRLEIASMFAHFTHETEHFCYIEEVNGSSRDYCDENNSRYPCAPGKNYYGRGPLQLSWNYNYGLCGQSLDLDLLRQPELVGSNPTVAFRTGLWSWMNSVRPVLDQGFGATIKVINSLECNGGNSDSVSARVRYYEDYCEQLDVTPDPGVNSTC